jgi:hypothetical protein
VSFFTLRFPEAARKEVEQHLRPGESIAAFILHACHSEVLKRCIPGPLDREAEINRRAHEIMELAAAWKADKPAPVVADSTKPLFQPNDLLSAKHPRYLAMIAEIHACASNTGMVCSCADWASWRDTQTKSPFRWVTLKDVLAYRMKSSKAKVEAMLELEPGVAALLRGSGAEAAEPAEM